MKPRYKFNLSIILASALVLCTLTGMGISIRCCMELADYCKNENMSATALDFSENMVFHAYYWMGIAFICICLTAAMPLWYFHHQKKLHSEQDTPMSDAQKGEFKKLRVNIHTREVTLGNISRKSRLQVVTLLDYLVKHPQHEISFSELNTVFHENFFDGSSSAKRKISTLKYEANEALKDMGFELLRLPPGKLVMATKKGN